MLVNQGLQVILVHLEHQDQRVSPDLVDHLDHLEAWGLQGLLDHWVTLGRLEILALLEPLVLLDQ